MRNCLVSEANLRVRHRQSLFKALIMQSASEKKLSTTYDLKSIATKSLSVRRQNSSGQAAMGSNAFDHKRILFIC